MGISDLVLMLMLMLVIVIVLVLVLVLVLGSQPKRRLLKETFNVQHRTRSLGLAVGLLFE